MKEDYISELIKHMNSTYPKVNGFDKQAMLKTVAAYFENITLAEVTKEAMLKAYKNI